VHTALDALDGRVSWADSIPPPQRVPSDLIEQGRAIPVARVAAMHEGKRRAQRTRRRELTGGAGSGPTPLPSDDATVIAPDSGTVAIGS
jgi:hypothetical protein